MLGTIDNLVMIKIHMYDEEGFNQDLETRTAARIVKKFMLVDGR